MSIEALVTVGDYDLPEPSTYNGSTSSLVSSGRNAAGVFIGSMVREDVGKVELSWRYLTVEQWSTILKLFGENDLGGKFINEVWFFDQVRGERIQRKMYVSDRSAGMWRRDPDTGKVLGWTNCSLSLVEV